MHEVAACNLFTSRMLRHFGLLWLDSLFNSFHVDYPTDLKRCRAAALQGVAKKANGRREPAIFTA